MDYIRSAEVTSGHARNRGCRAFWTILNRSICTHTARRRFCRHLNSWITFLICRCWCFPKEQRLMAASSSNSNLVSIWAESPIWFFLIPTNVGGMSGMTVEGRSSSPSRIWMIGLLIPVPPLCLIVFFVFFSVIRCLPCRGACPTGSVALPQRAREWSRVCKRVKGLVDKNLKDVKDNS